MEGLDGAGARRTVWAPPLGGTKRIAPHPTHQRRAPALSRRPFATPVSYRRALVEEGMSTTRFAPARRRPSAPADRYRAIARAAKQRRARRRLSPALTGVAWGGGCQGGSGAWGGASCC